MYERNRDNKTTTRRNKENTKVYTVNDIIQEIGLCAADEVFKPIVLNPQYFISNYARCVTTRKGKPRLLTPTLDKTYIRIEITTAKYKQVNIRLHELVALHFCNSLGYDINLFFDTKNRKKLHVHHIDGNPLNNNAKNLVILSPSAHKRLERFRDHYFKGVITTKNSKIECSTSSLEEFLLFATNNSPLQTDSIAWFIKSFDVKGEKVYKLLETPDCDFFVNVQPIKEKTDIILNSQTVKF